MEFGSPLIAGLSAGESAYAATVVFAAALIRGYSGFGLSAIVVISLTLVLPPAEVVPIGILLEIVASLGVLPQVWRVAAWPTMGLLLLGACLGTPLGVFLLTDLPVNVMRAAIASIVLCASLLLLFGTRWRLKPDTVPVLGTGAISGVANGAAAVGGLPVVLFFLSTDTVAATARATVIIYLMILGLYGSAALYIGGLLTLEVLARTALLCIPLFLGVAFGHRHFLRTSPESFRRFALWLLIVLSSAGLLRAILG